jgi:hypothetical protein
MCLPDIGPSPIYETEARPTPFVHVEQLEKSDVVASFDRDRTCTLRPTLANALAVP